MSNRASVLHTSTQTTSQNICKPYCTHIHVHTWSNTQMHNPTLRPKKSNVQKKKILLLFLLRLYMKLNKILMKVFEGCLFILLDDIVKYGNAIFTSLVSQIWLKRVCLKAQRQLIGVNEIFHVIKISIQIKADQL